MRGYDTEGKIICPAVMFYNCRAIFVEYIDIIRAPYYMVLHVLSKSNGMVESIFDASVIRGKTPEELAAYYYSRKDQNIMYGLIRDGDPDVDYDKVDEFLETLIGGASEIINCAPELNFSSTLKSLIINDSVLFGNIYIYYPYDNKDVEDDIKELYEENPKVHFVHGDFTEAIKKVPEDSTYVFSDITKIHTLEELGKLQLSSILVPIDYSYNYTDGNKENGLLVDIESMQKDHVFKFDMFVASTSV